MEQLDQQIGACGDVGRLDQRLLRRSLERRDLRHAVDQALVVDPADRVPIDRIAARIGEAARFALEIGTER